MKDQPIAGAKRAVLEHLWALAQQGTDAKGTKRIHKALALAAMLPPDINVVAFVVYPGTKREHVIVSPCDIVGA